MSETCRFGRSLATRPRTRALKRDGHVAGSAQASSKREHRLNAGSHPVATSTAAIRVCPVNVDSGRPVSANSGHSCARWRMAQVDPELPFKAGLINGRKARESGLRLKASVAPRTDIRSTSRVSSEPLRTKNSQLFREERLELGRVLFPAAGRYRVDRVACRRRGRCDLRPEPPLAGLP